MSGDATDTVSATERKKHLLILKKLKDPALFFGWVAGLLALSALLWGLCRPLTASYLMHAVNRTLMTTGQAVVLSGVLPHPPVRGPMGIWYTIKDSSDVMCIFTIMHDGILLPCGARIVDESTVQEIFPVGNHARQVFSRLSEGIVNLYAARIENSVSQWSKK